MKGQGKDKVVTEASSRFFMHEFKEFLNKTTKILAITRLIASKPKENYYYYYEAINFEVRPEARPSYDIRNSKPPPHTVARLIRTFISETQTDWDDKVKCYSHYYNTTPNALMTIPI